MPTILSCGHTEPDTEESYSVITKGEACGFEGYQKALFYKTVCHACKEDYAQEGILFNSEEEAYRWLQDKESA